MLKYILLATALGTVTANATELPRRIFGESESERAARLAWWQEGRFGMFIHFGLYALPARGEWVKSKEQIPEAEYDRYFAQFDPDLFDARTWVRTAKAAGMQYVVLTVKHHEGFCLWDTATTDYKITKTPFCRDLVREFADACHAEGMGLGFYYSIIDWHHPDFTVDATHPRRPFADSRDVNDANRAEYAAKVRAINANRDMAKYRAYMFAQVKEILSGYGKVDIVWFDYVDKGLFHKTWRDYDSVELLKLARRLQPGIIVDSRLDLMETEDGWDFVTPEQFKPQSAPTVRGRKVPWETCQTFSGSWGYARDEATWKDLPQLIELLADVVSKDGNLILNVGPTARGVFDARAMERLEGFGRWMNLHSRAIRGCGAAPEGFAKPDGTLLTCNRRTNRLYVHLVDWPMGFLPVAFLDRIAYAQFLHDGSELKLRTPPKRHGQDGEQLHELGGIVLPMRRPAGVEVPVIEIFLKGE